VEGTLVVALGLRAVWRTFAYLKQAILARLAAPPPGLGPTRIGQARALVELATRALDEVIPSRIDVTWSTSTIYGREPDEILARERRVAFCGLERGIAYIWRETGQSTTRRSSHACVTAASTSSCRSPRSPRV
jgi:hypothetical protein